MKTENENVEHTGRIMVQEFKTIEELISAQMDHFKEVLISQKKMPIIVFAAEAEKTDDGGCVMHWGTVGSVQNHACDRPAVRMAMMKMAMRR